ncbi:unnamed protein product [Moneuplotes crassus]|uniref:Uncharacterized protein n=1 Tax=Euplotes crassus TaxID=5936 RepID=A0AAD2D6J0_EUPCR|nr:unnamed protein product [Moneuplotes crassus]
MTTELETLPQVTYLPIQLSQLVIKKWTGDIIDYEKGAQIAKVYHGRGRCEFKEGHIYNGEMKYGLLHGEGEFIWKDGTKYYGQFQNNEITGKGKYDWTDKSTYFGYVKNGMRHGEGKYLNKNEGVEYNGEWQNGLRHGEGILKYKNGSIYDGNWEMGQKSGKGKMTYASGNFYEGEWKNNKRNGEGVMHWKTTNEKYTGHWEDGYQSGFGTHIWLEGSGENKLLRNRYVGYWKKGLRHGQGTFYYSNGSKYEGEWKDNLKDGAGIFTFEDGTTYNGPFKNDRMVERSLQGVAQIGSGEGSTEMTKNRSIKPKGQNDKVVASNRVKKEVEANPFKILIDITDLVELERNSAEVEKEIQNILLRYNSDIKRWYKIYSKKVEAVKSEESFALTLRQVWRFFRDTQITSSDSTLAIIDRVFNQGRKNHFTILGEKDKKKFHLAASKVGEWRPTTEKTTEKHTANVEGSVIEENKDFNPSRDGNMNIGNPDAIGENVGDSFIIEKQDNVKIESSKLDILDSDSEEEIEEFAEVDADSLHEPTKAILQRQFFEAIVRACHVSYANTTNFKTLAEKLDHMMKNHCAPFATKNKSKTPEDEKSYKAAEKIFEMLGSEINFLFDSISKKDGKAVFGVIDKTIEVEDLVQFCKRIDLLWNETPPQKDKPEEPKEDSPEAEGEGEGDHEADKDASKSKQIDKSKITKSNEEEKKEEGEGEGEEAPEDQPEAEFKCPDDKISLLELIRIIEKYYNPRKTLQAIIQEKIDPDDYNKEYNIHKLTNRYYMHIKGSEMIQYEFKEILIEISMLLKSKVEEPSGKLKVRSTLKRFIEEILLKRYAAFSKLPRKVQTFNTTQQWPDSYKDQLIKERTEAEKIRQKEERKLKEMQEKEARELELMRQEDTPALSSEEIQELMRQKELEERLKKEQEEADALDEDEDEDLDDDEDIDEDDDYDYEE